MFVFNHSFRCFCLVLMAGVTMLSACGGLSVSSDLVDDSVDVTVVPDDVVLDFAGPGDVEVFDDVVSELGDSAFELVDAVSELHDTFVKDVDPDVDVTFPHDAVTDSDVLEFADVIRDIKSDDSGDQGCISECDGSICGPDPVCGRSCGTCDNGCSCEGGACTADCIDPDTDGDGIIDIMDNCPYIANPLQENMDFDAYGDVCDCDIDADGVENNNVGCPFVETPDNCVFVPNVNQRDTDSDGTGDACDCDIDDDNVYNNNVGCPPADPEDNCPYTPNPDQDPSACIPDNCLPLSDWDNDSVDCAEDNCPLVPNVMQEDSDVDGIGDACDCDADSDGIINPGENYDGLPCLPVGTPDNCPLIANIGQEDFDHDGIGDQCDCDIDGDGDPQAGFGCPTPAVPDCDPDDARVSHLASETCGNGIDDNCDGLTDEELCSLPE